MYRAPVYFCLFCFYQSFSVISHVQVGFDQLFMCFFVILFSDWRSKLGQDHRPRHAEPAVPSGSSLLPEFDGDVSPWNTRESMRASDDVAQLLVSDGIVVVSM